MSLLIRTLGTGEVAVFDKSKRELYLISKKASKAKKGVGIKQVQELVKSGAARHFKKSDLAAMSEALAGIVLLG